MHALIQVHNWQVLRASLFKQNVCRADLSIPRQEGNRMVQSPNLAVCNSAPALANRLGWIIDLCNSRSVCSSGIAHPRCGGPSNTCTRTDVKTSDDANDSAASFHVGNIERLSSLQLHSPCVWGRSIESLLLSAHIRLLL